MMLPIGRMSAPDAIAPSAESASGCAFPTRDTVYRFRVRLVDLACFAASAYNPRPETPEPRPPRRRIRNRCSATARIDLAVRPVACNNGAVGACKTKSWAILLNPRKRTALGFNRDRVQPPGNHPMVLVIFSTCTYERATALRCVALSYLPNLLWFIRLKRAQPTIATQDCATEGVPVPLLCSAISGRSNRRFDAGRTGLRGGWLEQRGGTGTCPPSTFHRLKYASAG